MLQRATSGDWPVLEDIQQEMIDAAFVAGIENVGNSRVQIPNLDAKPFDSAAAVRTPRRPWVFGTLLLRRYVSALIAPPGAGKTNFGIHTGIALATGREWAGMQPHDPGPVWIINAEEDLEELNRRVLAAAIHMGVDPADLDDRLFVNSGADREIQLARENPKTREIDSLPDVETIINVIRQRGIRLLILDPLAEFHTAPEGNNDAMKIVAKLCRQIAQRADCAVLLAHHPRKSPAGDADGHAGNMDSARGASALVGVTRVVSTLLGMSKKEADRLGIADEDRRLYVRLDDAKANMSLITSRAKWFRRESVELSNAPLGLDGDVVGVLEPVDLHNLETAAETHAKTQDERIARAVLGLVEDGKKTTSGLAETLIQTDSNFFEWRPSTLAERIKQVCQPHRAVNGFILKYVHQQAGNGRHWIMAENYENA